MDNDVPLSVLYFIISVSLYAVAVILENSIASIKGEQIQRLVSEDVPGSTHLEKLHLRSIRPTEAMLLVRVVILALVILTGLNFLSLSYGHNATVFAVGVAVILVCLGAIHLLTNLLYASRLERLALKIARPVLWLTWPLILLGNVKTRLGVLTVNSPNTDSGSEVMKDEEELSAEPLSDPVDEREARMIRGVIRQDRTVAREIMVPRVDIVAVEIETQIEVLASLMVDGGHSRVPVYRGDLDHVIGIAYSKDLLRHLSPGNGDVNLNQSLEEVIRPALFIPESKTLEELLGEFKNRRVHIAIVIDEYGGVSGLVTIEDLIEEIVGEIEDEFDLGEAEIERINNDEFVMNASVNLDQLRDLFSVEIQSDGFDTVGGLVYQRLGKIPSSGDSVEHVGIRIEVLSTSGRRLKNLKVTKLPEFKS